MENMPGMEGMASPPPPSTAGSMDHHSPEPMTDMHMAITHMTFFWGKNSEILFSGWPGTRAGMYVLALIFVFVLAIMVEWLSGCQRMKEERSGHFCGGLIRTIVHGTRIALGYLVMLALMSFNVGVFIVVVAGHSLGFFLFGSRVFSKSDDSGKDVRPLAGC